MITLTTEKRNAKIDLGIQQVYQAAELDQDKLTPGIVRLHDLISAYPIRVESLKNLTYFRAIQFIAAETAQTISIPEMEDRLLAGFLYIYEYTGVPYGCILVKANDPVVRQRFSAAHELGHYILHFLPLLERQSQDNLSEALVLTEGLAYPDEDRNLNDMPSGQLTFTRGQGAEMYTLTDNLEQIKLEANQFAAELLMPESACRILVDRYRHRFGNKQSVLARRLATEFLVSRAAMNRRLQDLMLP